MGNGIFLALSLSFLTDRKVKERVYLVLFEFLLVIKMENLSVKICVHSIPIQKIDIFQHRRKEVQIEFRDITNNH